MMYSEKAPSHHRVRGGWPNACASCGYVITSDGDEMRHIDRHMGREPNEERYAAYDRWEQDGKR